MKIADYLDQHNITYAEFAQLMGLSIGAAWKLANGKNKRMCPVTWAKIEEVTQGKVTTNDFFVDYAALGIDPPQHKPPPDG